MLTKVRSFIDKYNLLRRGDQILAACSGGPDSLALVHALYRLRSKYGITLAVAHVNHMFRGAEADADAVFVGRLCAELNLPFYQTAIDVPAYIAASGRSSQDAARVLRYRYLRQVATLTGAWIATGHHLDDQAETVLLNLLRGAGSGGLAGMKPVGDSIIRPFLNITRADIESYCRENNLTPRLDKSNLKTDYLRNYLRLELMPALRRRFNSNLAGTLCRTAQLVNDEHEYIAEQARNAWPLVAKQGQDGIEIDCKLLNVLHIALRREIIRQAIKKKQGHLKGITFLHVEKLLELAENGNTGRVIELPGDVVGRRNYDIIVIQTFLSEKPLTGIDPPGHELKIPGVTTVPALNLKITAALLTERPPGGADEALFDWEQLTSPLYVRTRLEGDRFRPAGAPGGKKLKSFFIDAKIPRGERDRIPLICDTQGILWLAGYRQSERAKPGPETKHFLHLIRQQGD